LVQGGNAIAKCGFSKTGKVCAKAGVVAAPGSQRTAAELRTEVRTANLHGRDREIESPTRIRDTRGPGLESGAQVAAVCDHTEVKIGATEPAGSVVCNKVVVDVSNGPEVRVLVELIAVSEVEEQVRGGTLSTGRLETDDEIGIAECPCRDGR